MKKAKINQALLEIGVEEIPARFIPPALEQLQDLASRAFSERHLKFGSIGVLGSPRRLTLLVNDIAAKTDDAEELFIGPPSKAAKDNNGQWTQAATGFAKAQNVPVSSLVLENTAKGERFVVRKLLKGKKTELVLAEIFPELIRGLSFPKNMVWEETQFRFARPIRWIVALLNSRVIRFKIAGIVSDHSTYGLLALGAQKLTVSSPDKYKTILQNRCILVDPADRKRKILDQLESISKKHKVSAVADADHVMEVVNITEYPVGIVGEFDKGYLTLPREVLVSVLRKHQKFFPLESSKKQLTNLFVGVRNGPSESQETVREGYEKVLSARLADAKFFFDHDCARKLDDLVPRLAEIGFHEKMGSLLDKTNRVKALAASLASKLAFSSEQIALIDRAITLSKADLLTQMVGEFPELQGIAGRFYAATKEDGEVSRAIEQHYWPLSASSVLPTTDIAALIAIADKMDTLAADFALGLIPSGSADPYGLRRAALGVLRILLEKKWVLPLAQLVDLAFAHLPAEYKNQDKGQQELRKFFTQRFSAYFENLGYRVDEIEAVCSVSTDDPAMQEHKLAGLKSIRQRPEFSTLAAAIKRSRNILVQAKEKGFNVDAALDHLSGEPEQNLYASIQKAENPLEAALQKRDYHQALLVLAELKTPIDHFFEKVMVMVDDEKLRTQRLSLLSSVKRLFDSVVDFSKLQATA